jgi:transcriptional regulator with XRE-family HTH domain
MTFEKWITKRGGVLRVAELIGVSPDAVWAWLRGDRYPTPETLIKIHTLTRGKVAIVDLLKGISEKRS